MMCSNLNSYNQMHEFCLSIWSRLITHRENTALKCFSKIAVLGSVMAQSHVLFMPCTFW